MGENGEAGKLSDRERSLLDDNVSLKAQLKELEVTFNKMQADFTRSIKMREKLDSLCKVLQKQSQEIKNESTAEIGKAEGQGTKLAREVADNMEMMEGVNKQLTDIMDESLKGKHENIALTEEVAELKIKYDQRHEKMTQELQAASDDLIKTKTELAQLRLKSAKDREETYSEMHKIANVLIENRQQMKDAKEMEIELRDKLKSYTDKFSALQDSLQATNTGYSAFTGDMDKVNKMAKDLDKETQGWQERWEVNNAELVDITKKHEVIQTEVAKVHENLIKMTTLYHKLESERNGLCKKLGKDPSKPLMTVDPSSSTTSTTPPTTTTKETPPEK